MSEGQLRLPVKATRKMMGHTPSGTEDGLMIETLLRGQSLGVERSKPRVSGEMRFRVVNVQIYCAEDQKAIRLPPVWRDSMVLVVTCTDSHTVKPSNLEGTVGCSVVATGTRQHTQTSWCGPLFLTPRR